MRRLLIVLAVFLGFAASAFAQQPGTLIVVGGGNTGPDIVSKALEIAGAANAVIAVLPQASSQPDAGDGSVKMWQDARAKEAIKVSFDDRDAAAAALKRATLIWIPGGDQNRFMNAIHGTGLDDKGLPVVAAQVVTPAMWLQAARTLTRLAELGERAGRVFTLENLNTAVDHPGTPFARAADTVALVEAIGSPHLRLNLDLYHAQIGEGNLIQLVERALPLVGEIQVADVPGRCEPGTGEINYPAVAAALNRRNYAGVVGLEAWASGDSEQALERFRAAFTLA